MRPIVLAVLALTSIVAAPPSRAEDLAKALDGAFCYERATTAARRSDARELAIKAAPEDVPRAEGSIAVEVSMAGGSLSGIAACAAGDGRLDCLMEGDAGSFAVTLDGPALVVWSGPDGIGFEGAEGWVTWGDGGGRSATLAACAAPESGAESGPILAAAPRGGR